ERALIEQLVDIALHAPKASAEVIVVIARQGRRFALRAEDGELPDQPSEFGIRRQRVNALGKGGYAEMGESTVQDAQALEEVPVAGRGADKGNVSTSHLLGPLFDQLTDAVVDRREDAIHED